MISFWDAVQSGLIAGGTPGVILLLSQDRKSRRLLGAACGIPVQLAWAEMCWDARQGGATWVALFLLGRYLWMLWKR